MAINATLGVITWTPVKAQVGSYTITVQATDNGTPNQSAITTFKVTVNKANTAPVLAALADQAIETEKAWTVSASATDADGNRLTYSLINPPSGMSINSGSGLISWTPKRNQAGTTQVTVQVTDDGSP